jgi:single-strand DNA-binding protein
MAGTYQKTVIVGRLGTDPELRYTPAGTPVANMSVATSEKYKGQGGSIQEKTEWHRVVAFGKAAENCSQYLTKGRLVLVEGTLQTDKWQDQQGNDRYTTKIKVFRVVFLGGQSQSQGQQGQDYTQQSSPPPWNQGQQPQPQQQAQKQDPFSENPGPAFPSEAGAIDEAPF